jgi:hypothetical protein
MSFRTWQYVLVFGRSFVLFLSKVNSCIIQVILFYSLQIMVLFPVGARNNFFLSSEPG